MAAYAGLILAKIFPHQTHRISLTAKIMMGVMAKRPTLEQVAEASHVSVSTASKALNGTGRISAETRRIIQQNAQQIGYRKSNASAARKHSGLVGLITSDHNGRFALPLLVGAETTLGASNHAALLMSSHGSLSLEQNHINQLAARGVDGLIVLGDTTNPRPPLDTSVTMGLPTVYVYDPSKSIDDCSIICDNVGAGTQAIEYLLGIGRTHIAIVGGGENFQASKDRIRGAIAAFDMYGEQPTGVLLDRWSEEWGEQASRVLLDAYPDVNAVYCLNDEIARGMIRGLLAAGKRVPQDIAIVGHDDWEVFSLGMHPTITTFKNNMPLLGKTAAKMLLRAFRGKPYHGTIAIECPIVIRESTETGKHTPVRGSGWFSGLEDRH